MPGLPRFSPSVFGIFDAFVDDAGRQAHLTGRLATELMARADELFTAPPEVKSADVLAHKGS